MRTIARRLLRILLVLLYRVEVRGREHYRDTSGSLMVVANHTSFLDGVLLGAFLSDRFTFVVNTQVAQRWWARPFLALASVVTVDFANPLSLKNVIHHLRAGAQVVIFPEGRITQTGSLMKVYQGPAMVADKANCRILPVRIEGAQYTPFSRLRGKLRRRWFPRITLTILPMESLELDDSLHGRERRDAAGRQLVSIMTSMMFRSADLDDTLFGRLLKARRIYGGKHEVVEDSTRQVMTYDQLITRACVLGTLLAPATRAGEQVGLLLPNSSGMLVTFMALQLHGRVPVMLNFSAGARALCSAVRTAQVRVVYTAHAFVEKAALEASIDALQDQVEIRYLEELRERVSVGMKLRGKLIASFIHGYYRWHGGRRRPDDPAVLLFTSGSEGDPKGVMLSHRNLVANCEQIAARVEFNSQDVVLNVLPVFHAFGLTGGTLLPLYQGMKVFLYPSPLHYRVIPEIAYDIAATILFGTNTFLYHYAVHAHPYDFYKMRYVVAGAERLSARTRELWIEKFGIRIFEGYGVTEAAPVLSVNTPMDYRAGSVGQLLPGIDSRLAEVEGVSRGGCLLVSGPNVMLGYLFPEQPGVLCPPAHAGEAGWYDTGDVVVIDQDGYLYISGRIKRFAKLGGEMVSLARVEQLAAAVSPDAGHVAVNMPDSSKGEQIILLTTDQELKREEIIEQARRDELSALYIPVRVLAVEELPLLGSGKVDFAAVQRLASDRLAQQESPS